MAGSILDEVDGLAAKILDEFAEEPPDRLALALAVAASKVLARKANSLDGTLRGREVLLKNKVGELATIVSVSSVMELAKLVNRASR